MDIKKTQLSIPEVEAFLRTQFNGEISPPLQMIEGEESQAFSFLYTPDEPDGETQEYVLRINPTISGFTKDEYAYKHFCSEDLPIPEVIRMGQIDDTHAFCISERISGETLQDVSFISEYLLRNVYIASDAIWDTKISATTGYGDFDASGQGRYPSWHAYLDALLDPAEYDWERIRPHCDAQLLTRLQDTYAALIPRCPERRELIHGDFGSNNVLIQDDEVVAVLDWENAKYGDSLYDVATAYFWRTWLNCMEQSVQFYEEFLANIPDYRVSIACYQLHIGLKEIYSYTLKQDWQMARWVQERCRAILAETV